jgi:hypothetical protein
MTTLTQQKSIRWDKIDKKLRNLKTVDTNAGDELKKMFPRSHGSCVWE